MENPDEALREMSELRALGVSLALDDFGTGHSSLAHLREFPIDTLKIAREFVVGLPTAPSTRPSSRRSCGSAARSGTRSSPRGSSPTEQARAVGELGCSLAQGFHFGQPLAPVGFTYAFSSARPRDRLLRVA